MARSSGYAPHPRRGRLQTRWHLLRRLPTIEPAWPWWVAWAVGGTAVAAGLDRAGLVPWWVGPPAGVVAGGVAVAATALDDVRHPLASLRVLAAEVRWPGPFEPGRAAAARADAFGIPLVAAPGAEAWLAGGGASYGPGLYAPTRPRLAVRWEHDGRETTATTVVGERVDTFRWLYDGWFRTRPWDPDDEDPDVDAPFDRAAAEAAVVPLAVTLDGHPFEAAAVDLAPWEGGWAASLQLNDAHQVDLVGEGPLPERLDLERRTPRSLVRAPGRS